MLLPALPPPVLQAGCPTGLPQKRTVIWVSFLKFYLKFCNLTREMQRDFYHIENFVNLDTA